MKINMRALFKTNIIFLAVALLGFVSCKSVEPLSMSDVDVDNLYRDVDSEDTITMADLPWEQLFTDVKLQALINEALVNNSDLKIAIARVKSAEANYQAATMSLFPSLNVNGNASYSSSSTVYQLYGASNWEIDVWGKLGNSRKASKAAYLQSEAYQRSVQTRLIANVANAYFALLSLDEQLRITEQTLEKRRESAEAMQLLKESNRVNGAAVVQSQASMYSTAVTIPTLRQSIYEAENNLCSLLGRSSGTIDRGELNSQSVGVDLKVGVPAQLLSNRPDVQQAEYQVDYYMQQVNVAKKSFYPSITITAQGGLSDNILSELFNPMDLFGNIVGGLTQPIFNHGANRRNMIVAQSNLEEGLASFKQTLLDAGNEVTNNLRSYQSASEKIEIRANQIKYLEQSVEYTRELLQYTSSTNYTDVLTSEQGLLTAQLSSISDKLEQLQALVNLYRSLGGGWEPKNEKK